MHSNLKFREKLAFILRDATVKSQDAKKNTANVIKAGLLAEINAFVMVVKIAIYFQNILVVIKMRPFQLITRNLMRIKMIKLWMTTIIEL
jgi:hypothetical protein